MSKLDPAASMATLLQSLVDKAMSDIHVGLPCRIITFDESSCTADVLPLIKTGEDEPAMILNVQALGQKLNIDGAKRCVSQTWLQVILCLYPLRMASSGIP